MKYLIKIAVLACIVATSCDSKVDRPEPVLTQQQVSQQNSKIEQSTIPVGNAVASNIQHYYCPNSCDGSGGDNAGSCPVCGTEYVHNQAYHNTPAANNNAINQTTAPLPEPAQNSAGIWHYTCSNGCSGGGGSATPCSQCGSTLVHNQAYHNS